MKQGFKVTTAPTNGAPVSARKTWPETVPSTCWAPPTTAELTPTEESRQNVAAKQTGRLASIFPMLLVALIRNDSLPRQLYSIAFNSEGCTPANHDHLPAPTLLPQHNPATSLPYPLFFGDKICLTNLRRAIAMRMGAGILLTKLPRITLRGTENPKRKPTTGKHDVVSPGLQFHPCPHQQ